MARHPHDNGNQPASFCLFDFLYDVLLSARSACFAVIKLVRIPFILILLLISVTVGFASGYMYGNRLKTRVDTLVESILTFENGNFAYRIPPLGDDEIGLAADQLNEMAKRVELQVASLQKLSNERAEWQVQMKKSVISEERQRLARDLHDAVSQQLFAISMMTSAVLEQVKGLMIKRSSGSSWSSIWQVKPKMK